jgi:hypothetical protein
MVAQPHVSTRRGPTPALSRALAVGLALVGYLAGLHAGELYSCHPPPVGATAQAAVAVGVDVNSVGPVAGYLASRFVPAQAAGLPSNAGSSPSDTPSPSATPSAFNARLSDRCAVSSLSCVWTGVGVVPGCVCEIESGAGGVSLAGCCAAAVAAGWLVSTCGSKLGSGWGPQLLLCVTVCRRGIVRTYVLRVFVVPF